MTNTMPIGPYRARIRYYHDDRKFRGLIKIGRDWIDFAGRSVRELEREGRKSLRFYQAGKAKRP